MKRLSLLLPLILIGHFQSHSQTPDHSARATNRIVTFNDDGAWSWFQDERAIVDRGKLIIGSVAAGTDDKSRKGDIEVVTYDIGSGNKTLSQLRDKLLDARGAYDDHNSPRAAGSPRRPIAGSLLDARAGEQILLPHIDQTSRSHKMAAGERLHTQ